MVLQPANSCNSLQGKPKASTRMYHCTCGSQSHATVLSGTLETDFYVAEMIDYNQYMRIIYRLRRQCHGKVFDFDLSFESAERVQEISSDLQFAPDYQEVEEGPRKCTRPTMRYDSPERERETC
ncbi:unnamed protein product [Chrysodeixis includens]|uniref:Uncharacterized protein n=1 Tax=Chrysodeixis includens TaxID=689277 RepID=A0A9N8KX04_CHRIL|nr:unnamed protein product [Chrysodeixis includens]